MKDIRGVYFFIKNWRILGGIPPPTQKNWKSPFFSISFRKPKKNQKITILVIRDVQNIFFDEGRGRSPLDRSFGECSVIFGIIRKTFANHQCFFCHFSIYFSIKTPPTHPKKEKLTTFFTYFFYHFFNRKIPPTHPLVSKKNWICFPSLKTYKKE